jgi:DNA replication protein DnaC
MFSEQLLAQMPDNVRRAVEQGGWENIPVQPPQFACMTCCDRHWYTPDVPPSDPCHGKPIACPECAGGRELAERQVKMRLVQAELPKNYQGLTFASWDKLSDAEKDGKFLALNCAKIFIESVDHRVSFKEAYRRCGRKLGAEDVERKSLIFQGPPGLGKTGLAAAIVNKKIELKQPVLYIRTQDFIESVKQSFDRDKKRGDETDTTQVVIDTVKKHECLVMDEFNVGVTNAWRQDLIENVIRYRYGNDLPTIITCNANEDELEHQWGTRVTSVLFAMAHWIPMGGVGLRDMRQSSEAF